MSKQFYHRMAAILICLAFLVSLAPALNCAEQNTPKPISLENLKVSFRLLSLIFPLLSPFSELQPDRARAVEKIDSGNNSGMIAKSTDDQIANQPKTKD